MDHSIIGDLIGCFINGRPYCPNKDDIFISDLDLLTLLHNSYGQFIVVEKNNKNINIFTSKSMSSLYYMKNDDIIILSSKLDGLQKYIENLNININELEAQNAYFYRSPFKTIINCVDIVPLASKISIDKDLGVVLSLWIDLTIDGGYKKSNTSFLSEFAKVVRRSNREVRLLLSGGIDSSLILAELINEDVNVNCVTITQKLNNRYSCFREIVDAVSISKYFNIKHNLEIVDLGIIDNFNFGAEMGWRWGWAYSIKDFSRDDIIEISGLGDAVVGIEHTAIKLFSKIYQSNSRTLSLYRALFQNYAYEKLCTELWKKNQFKIYKSTLWCPIFALPITKL